MKLIYEPNVYLVGGQTLSYGLKRFLMDEKIEDFSTSGEHDGDILVEVAGRMCYQSWKGGREHADYMENILSKGHGSVVEHCVFSLIFTGVSRTLTHELVRHRAGMSYSELSQRYVDLSDLRVVVPPALAPYVKKQLSGEAIQEADWPFMEAAKDFINSCSRAESKYAAMVAALSDRLPRKEAMQTARSILPGCTETKIFVTGNMRAWRNFLELRASPHADIEIRRLANRVFANLLTNTIFVQDYEAFNTEDGTFELKTEWKKV